VRTPVMEVPSRLLGGWVGIGEGAAGVAGGAAELTPQETEVLRLVARAGESGIAGTLRLVEQTAKMQVSRPLAELNLRGRVQAVV
jgi:DNA-binding NarL/FixJ family response regulator